MSVHDENTNYNSSVSWTTFISQANSLVQKIAETDLLLIYVVVFMFLTSAKHPWPYFTS